jgi:hypothetical protein
MRIFFSIVLLAVFALPSLAAERSPHLDIELSCTTCHTTSGWQDIRFDHATTPFSLTDQHAEQTCLSCHSVERFSNASSECSSCHVDYHQESLGSDCQTCHDSSAWKPTLFSHEMTAFPLWGAHSATDCIQCHQNEVSFQFAEVPQDCFDCHERAFTSSRTSVHLTAGPDCQTCHTLDEWSGGHDPMWIETRSGHHEVDCVRCHKRTEDYASHTCIDCHEFSQDVRDHRGIDPLDARCKECHANDFDD